MCDLTICNVCRRSNCRCQLKTEPFVLKFESQDSYDESLSEYPCCYVVERVSSESSCSAWDSPKQCLPVIPYNIVFSDNKIDVQLDSCNENKDPCKKIHPCRNITPPIPLSGIESSCNSPCDVELQQSSIKKSPCQEESYRTIPRQESQCQNERVIDHNQAIIPESEPELGQLYSPERFVERNPCRAPPYESQAECLVIKSPKIGKCYDNTPKMVDKSLDPIDYENEHHEKHFPKKKRLKNSGDELNKRSDFKKPQKSDMKVKTKENNLQKRVGNENSIFDDMDGGADQNIGTEQHSSSSSQMKLDENSEKEELMLSFRPKERSERSATMRGGKGSPSLSKALANRKLQKVLGSNEKLKASSTTEIQMQKERSWSDPMMLLAQDSSRRLQDSKVIEPLILPPTSSQERTSNRKARNKRKGSRFPSGKSERPVYDSSKPAMCKKCAMSPCNCLQTLPVSKSPTSTTKCNGCGKPRKWCSCSSYNKSDNKGTDNQKCNVCGNQRKFCSCGASAVPADIEIIISDKNSELKSIPSKRWIVPKVSSKATCRIVPKKPAQWRNACRIAPRCSTRNSSTPSICCKSCQNMPHRCSDNCKRAHTCCQTDRNDSCSEPTTVSDCCKCRVIPISIGRRGMDEVSSLSSPSCSHASPHADEYAHCCVHNACTCLPQSNCAQSREFVVPRTIHRSLTGGYKRSESKILCPKCHQLGLRCKCFKATKRLIRRPSDANETTDSSLASSDDQTSEKSTTPIPQKNSANTSINTEYLSECMQTPRDALFTKSFSSSCSSSEGSRNKGGSCSPCSPVSMKTKNSNNCKSCLQDKCQCQCEDCYDCWNVPTKIIPTDEERYSHISKIILNFQNSEIFQATYDVTIVIGLTLFPCHSIILMAHSDYFKKYFTSRRSLACCQQKPPVRISLEHTWVRPEAFQFIHHWLYTAQLCTNTPCQAVYVWMAAKELAMHELVQECKHYVRLTLTIETAMEYWDQAMCYALEDLRNMAGRYLVANFPSVVSSSTFLSYSAEQVVRFLSDDELRMESEKDVFCAALRWLSCSWRERKCQAEKILGCVRYVCMHPEELLECIYRNRNSEVLQDMDYLIRVIRQNT